MKQPSAFQLIIEQATEEVIEKGTDNVSDRDLYLASLGWLVSTLRQNGLNNNRRNGKLGKIQQYSIPALASGGILGILFLVIEQLAK